MTNRLARYWLMVLVGCCSVLLSACVSLPTSGPILPGSGGTQPPADDVEIAPEPPEDGASPRNIVEGFLHSMVNSQDGYAVARQYLTDNAAKKWRPEVGVEVYADGYANRVVGDSVVLRAPLVGQLSADGSYQAGNRNLDLDFKLEQVNGQWRIANPPDGVLLSQYLFKHFYQRVVLYYFDPSFQELVPDPVYLLRSSDMATTVLHRLIKGPTSWLAPVVATVIPGQARLTVGASTVGDGIVDVGFSNEVAELSEERRSQLAAQVTTTLAQANPAQRGVRFFSGGAKIAIREYNADGYVPMDVYRHLGPVPANLASQLYAVYQGRLTRVDETNGQAALQDAGGAFGRHGAVGSINSFAVSVAGDRVAATTGDKTRLLTGTFIDGKSSVVVEGIGELGRPQWSRFNELWVDVSTRDKSSMWVLNGTKPQFVSLPVDGKILAFRLSPDGLRAAIIRLTPEGTHQLGMVRVVRSDRIQLAGWRTLPNPGDAKIVRLKDVGWSKPTDLLVIVSDGPDSPGRPYTVNQEGTERSLIGQPDNWNATSVAITHRPEDQRIMMLTTESSVLRYEDQLRWPVFLRDVTAVGFPG